MVTPLSRFCRDTRGASLVEGLIAFPVIFLAITTLVEGGVALYQYNQVAKATAIGARLAAVSNPVMAGGGTRIAPDPDEDADGVPYEAGDPYPLDIPPVICGAGAANACDVARLGRIVGGTDGTCDAGAETGVLGMCDVAPRIRAENVRVSYIFSGLGYIGRPYNPVVTVRVEVVDLPFDFFLLGAIISNFTGDARRDGITIPTQAVTITSEDLSTTPLGVTPDPDA